MNRFPTKQLMTIEEAQRLSDPRTSREEDERRRQWSWQSVEGALSQQVSEEVLDKMESLRLRK